ncbi:acyltransferase [Vibrio vulnificus]|nr:acyltransferase [Vibrio vulnificus]HAS8501788.1 acyltransferase [Vibrio vulnificus]
MFWKIISTAYNLILAKLSPVVYAKKIGVNIKGNVKIYGSSYHMFSTEPFLVTLGDNVYISVNASFICHDGSTLIFRDKVPNLEIAGEIVVGNNVFIGAHSIILPNIHIGDNCIVAAGSVVTKDVPPNTVVAGNPARVIKSTDELEEKMKKNSLGFGDLCGEEKVKAYKAHFGKD